MGEETLNLKIDADVIARARAAGVDVEAFVSRELSRRVKSLEPESERRARVAKWEADNKNAIESYNREIDERGVFGEDLRGW